MSFIHVPQPPHYFWISCLNWTIMLNYRGHYYSSIFLATSSYLVMDTAARIRSEIVALALPSSWIFNGSPLLTWKLNLWSKNTVLKMMIKSLLKLMKRLSQSYLWWEAMKRPMWFMKSFAQINYCKKCNLLKTILRKIRECLLFWDNAIALVSSTYFRNIYVFVCEK